MAYEFFDKTISFYNSSELMKEIDCQINECSKNKGINVVDLFDSYNTGKINAPPVPVIIYHIHRKKINEGWDFRIESRQKATMSLASFFKKVTSTDKQ